MAVNPDDCPKRWLYFRCIYWWVSNELPYWLSPEFWLAPTLSKKKMVVERSLFLHLLPILHCEFVHEFVGSYNFTVIIVFFTEEIIV